MADMRWGACNHVHRQPRQGDPLTGMDTADGKKQVIARAHRTRQAPPATLSPMLLLSPLPCPEYLRRLAFGLACLLGCGWEKLRQAFHGCHTLFKEMGIMVS